MSRRGAREPEPPAGLCATCTHARELRSARGSTFWRCERAAWDERLRPYPPLPVRECPGHEPGRPRAPRS